MTADFIKIVGEILNIHPEPISEETATVELNMGELFKIATEFASQKDASKADNGLFFGQNVIASNYKYFDPYWKAIYISKHPTENSHIVILPARPDLNLEESTSIFEFVKPND